MMREWVGPDVELAFDFHGKMTPALAVEICHEMKGMRPMFVEEPVPQENAEAHEAGLRPRPVPDRDRRAPAHPLGVPASCSSIRRWRYIQPDVAHAGGISETEAHRQHGRAVLHAHHAPLRDRAGGVLGLHAGGCASCRTS